MCINIYIYIYIYIYTYTLFRLAGRSSPDVVPAEPVLGKVLEAPIPI